MSISSKRIYEKCEAKGCDEEGTIIIGSALWLCKEHRKNFSPKLNESEDIEN